MSGVKEQITLTPAISSIYFWIFSTVISFPLRISFLVMLSSVFNLDSICSIGLYWCTSLNSSFNISNFVPISFNAERYNNLIFRYSSITSCTSGNSNSLICLTPYHVCYSYSITVSLCIQ